MKNKQFRNESDSSRLRQQSILTQNEIRFAKSHAADLMPEIYQILKSKFPENELGFNLRVHSFIFLNDKSLRLIDHSFMESIIRKAISNLNSKNRAEAILRKPARKNANVKSEVNADE